MTEPVIYAPLSRYPAVVRDVSFVVDRRVTFADIQAGITEQENRLCRNVTFIDIYEGKGLVENERSLTVRMEYRDDERTLTEQEVEEVHNQIVHETERKLGIKRRF